MIGPVAPQFNATTKPAGPALRHAAEQLESQFLAEMLKSADLGETKGAFSGGVGEEQFASFLRAEQARAITEKGGIGLAESIFNTLIRRTGHGA